MEPNPKWSACDPFMIRAGVGFFFPSSIYLIYIYIFKILSIQHFAKTKPKPSPKYLQVIILHFVNGVVYMRMCPDSVRTSETVALVFSKDFLPYQNNAGLLSGFLLQ